MKKIKKQYISRDKYSDKIRPFIKKEIIKVLTGQRRVGKSYLLYQIIDLINSIEPKAKIIYINMELYDFFHLRNEHSLINYVNEHRDNNEYVFLLIDEVQEIENFQYALRSLLAEGNTDIYCTGSNAKMLSGDLATYLSGRYIEIKVFGLTFPEFLKFHKLKSEEESFNKYIQFGGLPYLKHLEMNSSVIYEYLKDIYSTILLKDVVDRYKIRNINFLENLIRFLSDNLGSLVSAKKISDYLKSQNLKISPQIVLDYLSILESTYFLYKVRRSDLQGKKIFEIGDKYYFEDIGIRNSIVGYKPNDINKLLENIVYIHLLSSGYKITVGQSNGKEIDFICEKQGEKIYVQVCYLLSDEKVIKREFGNLLMLENNYPKFVVTMDKVISQNTYKGIEHINIINFLCNKY